MLLWLILEGSNSPLTSLIFVLPLPLAWALGRIFPRMRRAFVALGGGLMIAYGFMFSHLLPDIHNHTAFQLFRWAMAFCGAFMIAAAWGNWLPPDEPEEEVRLRPTLGGPPRHFGKTS